MQHSRADGATLPHHRFGPTPGVFANHSGAIQQVIEVVLNDVSIPRMQMLRVGGKSAGFGLGVKRNLFATLIEDADQLRIPPHPYLSPDILWRHRIIGALELDVAIAMNQPWSFFKEWKQALWQRQ